MCAFAHAACVRAFIHSFVRTSVRANNADGDACGERRSSGANDADYFSKLVRRLHQPSIWDVNPTAVSE